MELYSKTREGDETGMNMTQLNERLMWRGQVLKRIRELDRSIPTIQVPYVKAAEEEERRRLIAAMRVMA